MICLKLNVNGGNDDCKTWSNKHLLTVNSEEYFNQSVYLVQFNDFAELTNISCNETEIDVNQIGVWSMTSGLFHTNFDFVQFFKKFKFDLHSEKFIYFLSFKGLNKESPKIHKKFLDKFSIQFRRSNFRFYSENKLITKETCLKENFNQSYFGQISKLFFITEVIYEENVCPFIFYLTNVISLGLSSITNSLLFKNRLSFLTINETNSFNMKTDQLNVLTLNIVYENIDRSLLNIHVFKNLRFLYMSGIIYKIEENLFKEFNLLRSLIIKPSDLGRFYQQDNLEWTLSLNSYMKKIDLSDSFQVRSNKENAIFLQIYETKSYFTRGYAYPNEDFCVFKNFPHEKLIFPSILFADEIQCTCTLFWLIQYSKFYMNEDFTVYKFTYYNYPEQLNTSSARNCLRNNDLKSEVKKCDFQERLEKCNLTNTNKELPFRGNINSFFVFEWFQYIIQVYFQTTFCLLGLMTNFITFLVIRQKAKPLEKPMYRHVYFNCIFNFFICFFTLISLINVCIFPKTSFCSSIMTSQLSQYFKIYMIYFLTNCLRLMSNISFICFSLSRFFISTSPSNKFAKKFEKLNLRKFYLILLTFCLAFSSFKIFEYDINKGHGLTNAKFPFSSYEYCVYVNSPFYSQNHLSKCKFFEIMILLNNTLNNVVIFLINICIDFLLLRYIREKIRKKIENHSAHEGDINLNHDKETKKKVIRLLIVNAVLAFLSRVPAFAVTIWLVAYKNQMSEFCYDYFSCTDMIDMAQAFEFVSIGLQFFILKKFDNNFLLEFHALVNLIFKKRQTQN